jgi:hypothetical protein
MRRVMSWMGDGLFARFHMKTLQRMIAEYEKGRDFATGQGVRQPSELACRMALRRLQQARMSPYGIDSRFGTWNHEASSSSVERHHSSQYSMAVSWPKSG